MSKEVCLSLLNEFFQGNWIELTINHGDSQFGIHNYLIENEINNKHGIYVYSLKNKCLYVGEGNCNGPNHNRNRLICHFNEAQWVTAYSYSDLFKWPIPQHVNCDKDGNILLPGKQRSSVHQVRFFSNPELRKNLTVYWKTIEEKKSIKIKKIITNEFRPIYDFDTANYYSEAILSKIVKDEWNLHLLD